MLSKSCMQPLVEWKNKPQSKDSRNLGELIFLGDRELMGLAVYRSGTLDYVYILLFFCFAVKDYSQMHLSLFFSFF